jgi:tricorn protease
MISISPDGKRAAYVPTSYRRGWKGYRGGTAPYIWLADLTTLDIVKVPHTAASDWNPMWIGNRVYFLSDRDGPGHALRVRCRHARGEPRPYARRL